MVAFSEGADVQAVEVENSGGSGDRLERVRCPRCGYDQQGEVAKWIDRCPLASRCTECGLEIEWAEIFSPRRRMPRWCIEYAPSVWAMPWRLVKTCLVALWPWAFWSRLRMVHEIRWRRMAVAGVLLFAAVYVLFCAGNGVVVEYQQGLRFIWSGKRWPSPDPTEIAHAVLLPWSDEGPPALTNGLPWQTGSPREVFLNEWLPPLSLMLPFVFVNALCPLGFIALPVSRRRAKVRWSHIARITIYGFLPGVPFLIGVIVATTLQHQHMVSMNRFAGVLDVLSVVAATAPFVLLALPCIWWSTATGRYLRMPHAWGVGVVVVVLAILVGLLVSGGLLALLSPH